MSPVARHASGGLVDPDAVVRTVLHLVSDPDSSGRVMVLRPDRDGIGGFWLAGLLPASIGEAPSAWSVTQPCVPAGLGSRSED